MSSSSSSSQVVEEKVDPLSIPELPETFEGRFEQLKFLIGKALLHLLDEVKKRDALAKAHPDGKYPLCLSPPYGRMPKPTPLITRAEFLAMKQRGLEEYKMNIEDIKDPEFEFKYGFNPVKYIADYLRWWHPSSAVERRQARAAAATSLQQAAVAAKQRCGEAEEAALRAVASSSGVLYGPLVTPLSDTSVVLVAASLQVP
jgi:hypothetical protein